MPVRYAGDTSPPPGAIITRTSTPASTAVVIASATLASRIRNGDLRYT
jgi:hypothetical protein